MKAKVCSGALSIRAFEGLCILFVFLFMCSHVRAEEAGYRLAPKDKIGISVWKDDALRRELVIPPDGIVSFPLVGNIKAKDMTVAEVQEIVSRKLSEFIPDPTVTVILLEPGSLTAYVIGMVKSPGEFPIGLDTSVMQILSTAGGLDTFASPKKIVILRRDGEKSIRIPFNYEKVKNGEAPEQNILLKRGDVVLVP